MTAAPIITEKVARTTALTITTAPSASAALVRYDAMCLAIANAREVDEVKDIRDKAIAFETYARQAKNTDNERLACEIRLRAERKAGELSKQLEKAPGARTDKQPPGIVPGGSTKQEKLEAAGISEDQARRWEKLAEVPQKDFDSILTDRSKMPTTTGIIRVANGKQKKRAERDRTKRDRERRRVEEAAGPSPTQAVTEFYEHRRQRRAEADEGVALVQEWARQAGGDFNKLVDIVKRVTSLEFGYALDRAAALRAAGHVEHHAADHHEHLAADDKPSRPDPDLADVPESMLLKVPNLESAA
ncbi:hypothetical protein SAMN05444161_5561 [Rhizobiales bacterium GAS191]|nr:hypothetical protein SAMN05444161_5561 [Rhizobiales bacterium GAS191]